MSVNLNPDLFQLAMSDEAQPLMDLVKKHCVENVAPVSYTHLTLPTTPYV